MSAATPLPSAEDLAKTLQAVAQQHRRPVMRALLPLVDALVREGTPYQTLASALSNDGVQITPEGLRKALYRWRKRNPDAIQLSLSSPAAASAAPRRTGLPHLPGVLNQQRVQRATPPRNRGDLARLREDSKALDLNELAEIGRQQQE